MPRPRSRYPQYRLHRHSGQAVVTIAGHDHYLGVHDSETSHQAYDRLVMEWIAQGRPRQTRRARDLTVAELCAAFWDYRKAKRQANGQPSGELAPVKSIIRILRKRYGTTPVADFRPKSLKALRLFMIRKMKWSRKNINRQILRVRHIFRWGASEDLCSHRTYRRLTTVQGLTVGEDNVREKPPVIDVDMATVNATVVYLPPVARDMVQLQLLTGARPDEICSLRWIDVDRSKNVWRYRPRQHKNKHRGIERIIFIGRKGQRILTRYLDQPAESFCFSPAKSEQLRLARIHRQRKTPLKHGNRPGTNRRAKPQRKPGERYTASSYRRAIHRACCAGKIAPWSPNQLRHAAATKAREIGGLDASQAILGHQHARMAETYAHLNERKAEEVMRKIG